MIYHSPIDFGRGRSWLRNALNEHSLEKYITIILEDCSNYRKQFYDDWGLLLDERSSCLISSIQALSSILFALNIDIPDLDVSLISGHTQNNGQERDMNRLIPVKKSEHTALVRSHQKSKVITLNDGELSDTNSDSYARSAPVPSFMAASSSSAMCTSIQSSASPEPKLIATKSSSSLSINDKMVLYPIYDADSSVDSIAETINGNTVSDGLIFAQKLKDLEQEKEKILRDNSLLKIQLSKYCAAIELLKYNKSASTDDACSSDRETASLHGDIQDYEKKLVQVSEMHGELVEFNEHLYRVIQQKDSIISRLRDELIELRGPVRVTLLWAWTCS